MKRAAATIVAFVLVAGGTAHAGHARFALDSAELQSAGGAASVYERLRAVAVDYCQVESRRSLKAFRREEACIADISGQFVERIGDSRLTALHASPAQSMRRE